MAIPAVPLQPGSPLLPELAGAGGLLGACLDLLHDPRVAVGVGEFEQRSAVTFVDDVDLPRLHAAGEQFFAGAVGVGDDESGGP